MPIRVYPHLHRLVENKFAKMVECYSKQSCENNDF